MQAYRVTAEMQPNGMLLIQNVPFHAGQPVEVIILVRPTLPDDRRYSLRGLPLHYTQPTEPVADRDWDAL